MRPSFLAGLAAINASLYLLAAAETVTNLFQVDVNSDNLGGCGSVSEEYLNELILEAIQLAEIGIQATSQYGTDPAATRLLDAFFFKGQGSSSIQHIHDSYAMVGNFLVGNLALDSGKPWLFCDSTWLVAQTMADEAHDADGEPFPNGKLDGGAALIMDVEQYVQDQQELEDILTEEEGKRVKAIPYWSPHHKDYLFDRVYPGKTYCKSKGSQAATQDQTTPSTLTLCPRSFKPRVAKREKPAGPAATVDMIRDKKAPRSTQMLAKVLPTSITLFHELFHLIGGAAETRPEDGGEEYDVFGMLSALSPAGAARNPETYSVVAVAYDYTMATRRQGGDVVEFFTGFATTGSPQ